MNCSSRVSSSLTGRPVLSAASARISSTNISCLPPKPPPTRSQNTRTLSGASAKISLSARRVRNRSEEHTSELQSHVNLVCRLLLEKKKKKEDDREKS